MAKVSFRDRLVGITRSKRYRQTTAFLQRRPLASFLLGLLVLFLIIALGSILSNLGKKEQPKKTIVKDVTVYRVNGIPSVTVQAKISKLGVMQIVAQSAGVVQALNVKEGDSVSKGETLVTMSSTYQGGNAPALQLQLAQTQYNNVLSTYDTQKDLIAKQREVAEKTGENADAMRQIASDSAGDVQNLLNLNEGFLSAMDANIDQLQRTNIDGVNDQLIAQAQQSRAPVLSGVVQLRTQVRSLNLQKDPSAAPAQLADLQKDITLKQLDVQEKALDLSRESARIQRDLASVQASLMTPASPVSGTVERIAVRVGQTVSPGAPIATVQGSDDAVKAEALVPRDIALSVSQSEPSTLTIGSDQYKMVPYFVSQEATSGQLYSVLYTIPDGLTQDVTDGEYASIQIPIGYRMSKSDPYVPLDAVFQTENEAYVYVVQNGKAESKKVGLGDVFGKFVSVVLGLTDTDEIILNRNVVSGDKIRITK